MARPHPIDDESGAAALEFLFVLPVMLLIYLGMVQLTAFLSVKHKLSSSATVMADLVTRHRDAIRVSDLQDYFEAAKLVMESPSEQMSIRVFVYRPRGGGRAPRLVWGLQDGVTHTCAQPQAADLTNLTVTGSDIVVVVTCMNFVFPVPQFLGFTLFARPTVTLRQQAIMRPRTYLQINCRDCPSL